MEARGWAENVGSGAFGAELAGRVAGGGIEGEGAAVAMAGGGCSPDPIEGAGGAGFCGGGRVAEDEKFDEGAD